MTLKIQDEPTFMKGSWLIGKIWKDKENKCSETSTWREAGKGLISKGEWKTYEIQRCSKGEIERCSKEKKWKREGKT